MYFSAFIILHFFVCLFVSAARPLSQHSFRPNFLATAHQLKEEGFKVSNERPDFSLKRYTEHRLLVLILSCLKNKIKIVCCDASFLSSSSMLLKPRLPGCVLMMCLPLQLPGPLRRKETPVCPALRGRHIFIRKPKWCLNSFDTFIKMENKAS